MKIKPGQIFIHKRHSVAIMITEASEIISALLFDLSDNYSWRGITKTMSQPNADDVIPENWDYVGMII